MTDLNQQWENLSSKVISSVIVDNGAIIVYMNNTGANRNIFHGKYHEIWEAIEQIYNEGKPPLADLVIGRLPSKTGQIEVLANQFNEYDNQNLPTLLSELERIATLMRLRILGQRMSTLDDPDQIAKIETEILEIQSQTQRRSPDAIDVSKQLYKELSNQDINPIPTGISWIDDPLEGIGGFWPHKNYWIVGPYKMFKTSMARNILLHAAQSGVPTTFFAAEGTRVELALNCQVMLAVRILIDRGTPADEIRLSSKLIRWVVSQQKQLYDFEREAMLQARKTWESLPIRVYDSLDNITNLTSMHAAIKRDKMERGTKLFFIDYSQIVGDLGAKLFDRQEATAFFVQRVSNREGVAIVAISQQNEEAIRGGNQHSTGAKGGGDANAAADASFITKVDPEINEHVLIRLHLGRDAAQSNHWHLVHPKSGLILGPLQKSSVMMH